MLVTVVARLPITEGLHTGVSMCARSHFGTPLAGETKRYLRVAYSGIDVALIEEGLSRLKKYLEG